MRFHEPVVHPHRATVNMGAYSVMILSQDAP